MEEQDEGREDGVVWRDAVGDEDGGYEVESKSGRGGDDDWSKARFDSVRGLTKPGVWLAPLLGVAIRTATSPSERGLGGVVGRAFASATWAERFFLFTERELYSRHFSRFVSVSLSSSCFRGRPGFFLGGTSPSASLAVSVSLFFFS